MNKAAAPNFRTRLRLDAEERGCASCTPKSTASGIELRVK